MPLYLLSVHHTADEIPPTEEQMAQMYADVGAFNERIEAEGAYVFAGGLEAPDTATVVRVVDGEAVLTDGPFAEAKEHIGGFWVLRADDLDAALAWARDASVACQGPVEVRPFQPDTE